MTGKLCIGREQYIHYVPQLLTASHFSWYFKRNSLMVEARSKLEMMAVAYMASTVSWLSSKAIDVFPTLFLRCSQRYSEYPVASKLHQHYTFVSLMARHFISSALLRGLDEGGVEHHNHLVMKDQRKSC
ncbi:hypothetical protein OUZ56_029455 [Daphnia magna]|uniref:Uncharacterized protein n=1 Tax=Daphnia magna TaxID=35525 RepID=A0ABR0B6V2_9CRUS|nr:hypothetical protein OUZ56_029455 [Daphnia magna]